VSRIGNKPIKIPDGIVVEIDGNFIKIKGSKGELSLEVDSTIELNYDNNTITLKNKNEKLKKAKAFHGLYRALINNMVIGVKEGYTKQLELHGIGYRAQLQGKSLLLSLGYSHQITVDPVAGIEYKVEGQNKILISGIDKQLVGQATSNIKKLRKTEPYKGKGIREATDIIILKQGKSVKK